MIARPNQYRGTDATCGGHAFMGGMRPLASIAPHKNQGRSVLSARISPTRANPYSAALHCRGFASRTFSQFAGGLQTRHGGSAIPSRLSRHLKFVRAVMAARRQSLPNQLHCKWAVGSEQGQSHRPFVESRSNDRERDTPERPKSWKPQPTRTAP